MWGSFFLCLQCIDIRIYNEVNLYQVIWGDFMKKALLIICVLLSFLQGKPASADALSEYELSQQELICAWASLGSYNDYVGSMARTELEDAGWDVQGFKEQYEGADAKFFIVKNIGFLPGQEEYLLAITGTESKQDISIDLKLNKVLFGGHAPEEFQTVAQTRNLRANQPMVHGGFHRYTQAAFFTQKYQGETIGEFWANLLRSDPKKKLYLTGHSLGGAVASLTAARLIAMGVLPSQIEVISFGAPAVGNEAFVEACGKDFPLKRIVIEGDPVESALQTLRPDYAQFKEKIEWKKDRHIEKMEHSMVIYLDAALRKYYDAKKNLGADMIVSKKQSEEKGNLMGKVYVAPLVLDTPKDLENDHFYMKSTLQELWQHRTPSCVFGEETKIGFAKTIEEAKKNNCQYVAFDAVTVTSLRNKRNEYYVSFTEEIYDIDGHLQLSLIRSADTSHLTILEALMHDWLGGKAEREKILSQK